MTISAILGRCYFCRDYVDGEQSFYLLLGGLYAHAGCYKANIKHDTVDDRKGNEERSQG